MQKLSCNKIPIVLFKIEFVRKRDGAKSNPVGSFKKKVPLLLRLQGLGKRKTIRTRKQRLLRRLRRIFRLLLTKQNQL